MLDDLDYPVEKWDSLWAIKETLILFNHLIIVNIRIWSLFFTLNWTPTIFICYLALSFKYYVFDVKFVYLTCHTFYYMLICITLLLLLLLLMIIERGLLCRTFQIVCWPIITIFFLLSCLSIFRLSTNYFCLSNIWPRSSLVINTIIAVFILPLYLTS